MLAYNLIQVSKMTMRKEPREFGSHLSISTNLAVPDVASPLGQSTSFALKNLFNQPTMLWLKLFKVRKNGPLDFDSLAPTHMWYVQFQFE